MYPSKNILEIPQTLMGIVPSHLVWVWLYHLKKIHHIRLNNIENSIKKLDSFNPIRSNVFRKLRTPRPPLDLENFCIKHHYIIHVHFTSFS